MTSDLEGWAGVAGPCGEVKGDDEVHASLRPEDERIGEVVGQTAVHYVDLLALDVQRLVDAVKLIGVCEWIQHNINVLIHCLICHRSTAECCFSSM